MRVAKTWVVTETILWKIVYFEKTRSSAGTLMVAFPVGWGGASGPVGVCGGGGGQAQWVREVIFQSVDRRFWF